MNTISEFPLQVMEKAVRQMRALGKDPSYDSPPMMDDRDVLEFVITRNFGTPFVEVLADALMGVSQKQSRELGMVLITFLSGNSQFAANQLRGLLHNALARKANNDLDLMVGENHHEVDA